MTRMLDRLLGEDITLKTECADNLPVIHADPGMIDQILLNLWVNARDAMPKGGLLTIQTAWRIVDGDMWPATLARASANSCRSA